MFLLVLVSQHVNLDALLIADYGYNDVFSSCEAEGSAMLCDTGVIAWKWPCVLPPVTCFKCYGNITLLAISL